MQQFEELITNAKCWERIEIEWQIDVKCKLLLWLITVRRLFFCFFFCFCFFVCFSSINIFLLLCLQTKKVNKIQIRQPKKTAITYTENYVDSNWNSYTHSNSELILLSFLYSFTTTKFWFNLFFQPGKWVKIMHPSCVAKVWISFWFLLCFSSNCEYYIRHWPDNEGSMQATNKTVIYK